MRKECFKAYHSQMFYKNNDTLFSNPKKYNSEASNVIAIGALQSSHKKILKDLERTGRVYYWLVDEDGYGVTHRFEGIKENRRWVFTRLRGSEKVLLGKIGVTKLRIQRNLTDNKIKEYGYLFGVPDKKDIP